MGIAERNEQLVSDKQPKQEWESNVGQGGNIVKLPKGTPMNAPVETLDPQYKGWSQTFRETNSFLAEFKRHQDDRQAQQIQETQQPPQNVVGALFSALGMPQQDVIKAGLGPYKQAGRANDVEHLIDSYIPGGSDTAITFLKSKGLGDNTIAAIFTLPAVALTLGTDPLNAVPGGGPAKAGAQAGASAAKAAGATKKAAPVFSSKSMS